MTTTTNELSDELKPCPWCSLRHVRYEPSLCRIVCQHCYAMGPRVFNLKVREWVTEARRLWNQREGEK